MKGGDRCSSILPAVARHQVIPGCLATIRLLLHDDNFCISQHIGVQNVEEDVVVSRTDSGGRSDDAIDEETVKVDGRAE